MAGAAQMGRLAVIAPVYGRPENTLPLIRRVMLESTRPPDEFWLVCETQDDLAVAMHAADVLEVTGLEAIRFCHLPTPRDENGRPTIIPYSYAINYALDRTEADYIVYLDNGSMPHVEKYEVMAKALAENPDWGAVYVGQERTGYKPETHHTRGEIADAFCVLNFTQVMHRRTNDRWTLDIGNAVPDLADAIFWRSLHASLGRFYAVGEGRILDTHHIPSDHATGL